MSLLADVLVSLVAILVVLGAYGGLSLGVLFLVELPGESPRPVLEDVLFPLLEDLAFVVTLPFVIAVVILPVTRPVARIAGRIDAVGATLRGGGRL